MSSMPRADNLVPCCVTKRALARLTNTKRKALNILTRAIQSVQTQRQFIHQGLYDFGSCSNTT